MNFLANPMYCSFLEFSLSATPQPELSCALALFLVSLVVSVCVTHYNNAYGHLAGLMCVL